MYNFQASEREKGNEDNLIHLTELGKKKKSWKLRGEKH